MRRQLRLRAVVERAAHRHAQVRARAAGARANDHHLATQLTECLQRAAAARDARLAAVAGKAAEAVSCPVFHLRLSRHESGGAWPSYLPSSST